MKVALLYCTDKNGKISSFAKEFERGLVERNFQVELKNIKDGSAPLSFYNFIIIGCYTSSIFGGKIDENMINFLKKSSGITGKHCFIFVDKKLGSFKTLSNLMRLLEKEGAIIFSSEEIKDKETAYRVAKKITIE